MHSISRLLVAALLSVAAAGVTLAAADYPLTLQADATLKGGATTVTSVVTIKLDRLMEESRRARVLDALEHGGYGNALTVLRGLPTIGTVGVQARTVNIKFAVETPNDAGRRLVLVADRPLFFLNTEADKPRAGFELTVVELQFDKAGRPTGTMAGAAKVKPTGDGNVAMSDFADAPVQLAVRSKTP